MFGKRFRIIGVITFRMLTIYLLRLYNEKHYIWNNRMRSFFWIDHKIYAQAS